MPPPRSQGNYARIHAVVRRIPRGRVASYGQVALVAGLPGHARQVGYALHALGPESGVPWQRVVNARGEVSPRRMPGWDAVQRVLLEREGIRFDARNRVDLACYGWRPGVRVPARTRTRSRAGSGARARTRRGARARARTKRRSA
jgi:methylated-DNA-protein-cysteine methyltransferase-like protein